MQPGHRRHALATVLVALAAAVVLPGPAQAAPGVTLSSTTVTSAPDFATDKYADPWDFANVDDLPMSAGRAGSGVSNISLQGGNYNADVSAGGWLNLVQTIAGSLPYGRDGQAIPIEIGRAHV